MNNLEERKKRYLQDSVQIRLGGLAANLARISSFSRSRENFKAVKGLIEESKFFIEWTAKDADAEITFGLVDLQLRLALLDVGWMKIGMTTIIAQISDGRRKNGRSRFYKVRV